MTKNRWNADEAKQLETDLAQLVYRSNLLGSDRSVANWGGGNTSMKTIAKDFRGREVEVMWVKGSGSDLATMKAKDFTCLRLNDIRPLLKRDAMSDEEMVEYLSHCMMDHQHPRPSIETLLHAFLPFPHVDHTHPDAIISICCAENGEEIAKEIFGDRFVWVPYLRPGFSLSKMIAEKVSENPQAECVLMEKHGLVTWGETAEACYHQTISIIQEAEAYIEKRVNEQELFGGRRYASLPSEQRKQILTKILPLIRGWVSKEKRAIVTYDDHQRVLTFVNSADAKALSQIGAACPDHLVHTKRTPLFIDWNPQTEDVTALIEKCKTGIRNYQEEYRQYFERNRNEGDQMAESSPRVILIPGLGMINTGKSWATANVSAALYHRAIEVMRGATTLSRFVSLNEKESYDVEYWPLELYKLTLAPPEAEFSRKVALITGGAGGIGKATCRRLADEGVHIVITDQNMEGAQAIADEINQTHGEGRAIALKMDVTKEDEIKAGFQQAVLTYGGVDIVINNAGLATANPIEETTLDEWKLNLDVLATGYYLVAREAFRVMKRQKLGGNLVFVGSKNAVYAGKNVTAYSTAKAAEIHLARCLAAEGGAAGIRVNSVLPDAVLQGSEIWNSEWRKERAAAYGISPDQLEEYYRKRTALGVNVYPQDVAEVIAFLASSRSAKTTGCMVTVDGGVPAAFTR